jgi:hypothetical protein
LRNDSKGIERETKITSPKWTPNILKKENNFKEKKIHVTASSKNTQLFIHKSSFRHWKKIIKSNMSKSSGKSGTLVLAEVVFLTGLECVCRIIQMVIQESA